MKKVIVIGGGFAGSHAAKKLEKHFNVILIDTKDYFEFTPGVLRSIVEPEHVRAIQILHSHYLTRAKVIIGKVGEVSRKFVVVGKKKLKFDYLVISSGSTYDTPIKEQQVVVATRARTLRNSYDNLCKAKKVLIIGGGLVGVELAGEIIDKYGDEKEITIAHSRNRLIERNHQVAISYAERFILKNGVKILFGERVKEVKGRMCLTESGKKIEADIVFLCTGIKPNFALMKKHFSSKLNEKYRVKVNEFLQLEGEENIFVAGDITAIDEEKTAQNAERQAEVVSKNIRALHKRRKLTKYEPRSRPLIISLGKHRAIFDNGNFVLRGWIPAMMKSMIEWWEMMKKRKVS